LKDYRLAAGEVFERDTLPSRSGSSVAVRDKIL